MSRRAQYQATARMIAARFSMSASAVLAQNMNPYMLRKIQPAVRACRAEPSLRPRLIGRPQGHQAGNGTGQPRHRFIEPAGDGNRRDDEPVAQEGLVEIGFAIDARVEVVAREPHLPDDLGPSVLGAP